MSDLLTRRDLFRVGGMIAVGLTAPAWLSSIAKANVLQKASGGKSLKDTVLVVCQLSGGNDGLNTVVPYATKKYYELRPQLALSDAEVLKLNNDLGFHPVMGGLKELYDEGKVAVIQNVGYPNPNRSHFKSMDIWQSASPDLSLKYGWIGRHFDHQRAYGPLNPVVALGLSTEKPRALNANDVSIPCFASLVDIQNMVGDPDAERMLRTIQGADAAPGSSRRVVQDANKAALDAMSELSKQLQKYTPTGTYENNSFGNGFKQIAQLIATSPATRVVYFSAGGFDTHARQADSHKTLMQNFSNAVNQFQKEMERLGKADKVLVLVFSEFGRRTYENASGGTDHGQAGPMFLIGKGVKGGIHGSNPDLNDLVDGDIRWKIDFRQVYAATLEEWVGGDASVVLGQEFKPIDVLK